jgi:N-acetylneuraminate synthase
MDCFNKFTIGKSKVFVIAEIGINHNGNIDTAKQLILAAKKNGADAVKFQKRSIDIVYTSEMLDSYRESPWGTTQREQKEGLEFDEKDYFEIDKFCNEVGIEWFASAWDEESQVFLRKFKLKYNKVASAMTTNLKFLEVVAKEKIPTFVSTGMCTIDEIETAVDIFAKNSCPIVLMHTCSEYPATNENLNLKMILTLKDKFNVNVGYSGHETSVIPSVFAVSLGAVAVERHLTLDRAMYGSDQAASLEPRGFKSMVEKIREFNEVYGDGVKKITEKELEVAEKLRYW